LLDCWSVCKPATIIVTVVILYSGVTRVGVTWGGNWLCRPIFSWTNWQRF